MLRRSRFIEDERGASLIEATLVIPMLIALVGGVIEFSNFFYQQHKMTTGVRDAARYLARFGAGAYAARTSDAQNLATTGSFASGGALRVPGWTSITVTPTTVANNDGAGAPLYRGCPNILIITVSGSAPYTPVMFPGPTFANNLGLAIPTVAAAHSERQIPDSPLVNPCA